MTPQEELEHERHIAEILDIRSPRKKEESRLGLWLNSNVMTALITVLGTALLGAWITGRIQDRSKQNELDRASQEKKLENQTMAVSRILDNIGTFMSASDDLLETVNNSHSEKGRTQDDAKRLREWKAVMAQARDDADKAWRREQARQAFTVQYLFDGNPSIKSTWEGMTKTESSFEECTREWYEKNGGNGTDLSTPEICQASRSALAKAVEDFAAAVSAAQKPAS